MTGRHAKVSDVTKTQVWDFIERVAWTAVQAFLGAFVVIFMASPLSSWSDLKDAGYAAAIGGMAAVISAVKVFIAQRFGNGTGATLPASVEPAP